mgnify:CR=1 FL=1
MYLLDTDILIWILRNNKKIIKIISDLSDQDELCISVMSIAEIYQNVFPSELTDTEDMINKYIIFDIDHKIAKMGGLYWQQYSKQLRNLTIADCLIAATASVNEAKVVSLNKKHFPMKDIQLLNL